MRDLNEKIISWYWGLLSLEDNKNTPGLNPVLKAKLAHLQNEHIKLLKKDLRLWYKTHNEDPDVSAVHFHSGIKPFTKKDLQIK